MYDNSSLKLSHIHVFSYASSILIYIALKLWCLSVLLENPDRHFECKYNYIVLY